MVNGDASKIAKKIITNVAFSLSRPDMALL